jgi:hypothetical protein
MKKPIVDETLLTMDEFKRQFASSGGKARAKAMSKPERSEVAKRAIRARWDKYYKTHPKPGKKKRKKK